MKRRFIFIAIVVVMIASIGASPSAKDDPIYINFWNDGDVYQKGDVLVWRWGWVNCSYGLSFDWRDITFQSYSNILLDGTEFTKDIDISEAGNLKYWGDPGHWPENPDDAPDDLGCYWDSTQAWRIWWTHPKLVFTKPGIYTFHATVGTTQEMIDGWHLEDPGGVPNLYEARTWVERDVTITILE